MKKGFVIAIDGPVASGKGTIAKKLAQKIQALNINSGGVYRAYAYKLVEQGITDLSDKNIDEYVKPGEVEIVLSKDFGSFDITLNGKSVIQKIQLPKISMAASNFGKNREFVSFISTELRRIVKGYEYTGKGIIMEGRQIGTDVFPDADVKIFLTADLETRASRRFEQYQQNGIEKTYEEVKQETQQRDEQDLNREFGALPKNPQERGYEIIDNTGLNEDQTLEQIVQILEDKKIWQMK